MRLGLRLGLAGLGLGLSGCVRATGDAFDEDYSACPVSARRARVAGLEVLRTAEPDALQGQWQALAPATLQVLGARRAPGETTAPGGHGGGL